MRWSPLVFDLVLAGVVWGAVLMTLRRARWPAPAAPERRTRRAETTAAISATIGFTWFVAWLATDAAGPYWLHALSMPASLIFIALGAVLAASARVGVRPRSRGLVD